MYSKLTVTVGIPIFVGYACNYLICIVVAEFTIDRGADIADMKKNLQNLYDYNVYLRERFMTVQSLLEDLLQKTSHAQHSTELCGEKG